MPRTEIALEPCGTTRLARWRMIAGAIIVRAVNSGTISVQQSLGRVDRSDFALQIQ
jgi:hypothetical protein